MSRRRGWLCRGRAGLLYAFAFVAGAAACRTDSATSTSAAADDDESSRLVSGSLCPSCQPTVGGESSDFEGELPECAAFFRRRAVTDEQAQAAGLDMPKIRALVTREFMAPLRWSESTPDIEAPAPSPAMPPSGFSAETSIHGVVSAASEIMLGELDPVLCDGASVCRAVGGEPLDCTAFIASATSMLELTLELETADAAIESSALSASLWLTRDDVRDVLSADFVGDLVSAQGLLRFGDGLPEPRSGVLRALLGFWPATVRGVLTPVMFSPKPALTDDVDGEGNATIQNTPYAPLSAHWPGDACEPIELPLDAATAEGREALERLTAEYPAAKARVEATPRLDASWFDSPGPIAARRTQIGLELLGDPRPSCVALFGEPHFHIDVHAWSEDGRLDWTLPLQAELRRRPGKTPALVFYGSQHFASDAEFWSSSLKGVDLLGAPTADVHLGAGYGLDDSSYIEGQLQVSAVPDCSRDSRCLSSNAPEAPPCADCGTAANVVRVEWRR
jgi:hypothetical protein